MVMPVLEAVKPRRDTGPTGWSWALPADDSYPSSLGAGRAAVRWAPTSSGESTVERMPPPDAVPGSVSERPAAGRWNHNIHYGLELLRAVPASASVALDVGCGEGWLVRELSRVVDHVIGVDPDEESVANARGYGPRGGAEYIVGDFLTYPFERASFDLITSVAALHHMDEEAALRRMAELLRPSGTLAVVGLGRSRLPADLAWELAGAVTTRAHRLTKSYWETPAPKVWPPPHSYDEVRLMSGFVLPGRQFQRRAMWRYVIKWTKPGTGLT
jgi:SAM-dependent methyltransferase